jgi:hypothetical protein
VRGWVVARLLPPIDSVAGMLVAQVLHAGADQVIAL